MNHLIAIMISAAASAEFNPEQYHQQHCTACHDERVYLRPNRRVHSLPQLESQIRFCSVNLNKKLFEEDIQALRDHLNQKYYRFDE